jgi:tetratricopeptide (TPR) repeat protein
VDPATPGRPVRPVFWLLALILVAAAVELGSGIIERVENAASRRKNPHVEAVNPVPAFEVVELGGRRMVRRTGFHPLMGPDVAPFPLERPAGGLRVFVLGGSAAAGWPYDRGDTNLSALLERKLRSIFPGRSVEVVNMAAGTYASHRVKLILEEVLGYNPDAIFVYNGNNEFLENLVYRPLTPPSPWDRSAALRLIYRVTVELATPRPRFDVQNFTLDAQVDNQLAFAFSRASRYHEDPRQLAGLLDHYRFNMESMAASAADAKVPLFLLTCPVNLKDWLPNVSRHRAELAPAERERFTERFRAGFLALERGEFAAAIDPLRAALAIDDQYAEAHFHLGAALRGAGRPVEAKAEYLLALERDAHPFRELPAFQRILREVAVKRGVPLVDVIPALEAVAGEGILGFDTFIDYVHLTEDAQEIVAHEMLRALRARGLLPGITAAQIEGARIAVDHRFWPERDFYAAVVNYEMAMLMHQYGRLDALYARAMEVFDRAAKERPALAGDCRDRKGLMRIVQAVVVPYRDLLRAEKLGVREETYPPEEVERILTSYREMIYQTKASRLSRQEFLERIPADPFER